MEKTNVEQETSIKPTKWRFVVLWLTWCYTFLTAFQFVQYIMVPDVLIEFFDVKNNHVSWTATIMNTGTGFKLKKTEKCVGFKNLEKNLKNLKNLEKKSGKMNGNPDHSIPTLSFQI